MTKAQMQKQIADLTSKLDELLVAAAGPVGTGNTKQGHKPRKAKAKAKAAQPAIVETGKRPWIGKGRTSRVLVTFPVKPEPDVLEEIKGQGFWAKRNPDTKAVVWHQKHTPEVLAFATALVAQYNKAHKLS
jgi:hypothetical protein